MPKEAKGFPRLYAAASLKPPVVNVAISIRLDRFPRLYAAASLKQERVLPGRERQVELSAALCRGLIEAATVRRASSMRWGFPRLYAAASLKLVFGVFDVIVW